MSNAAPRFPRSAETFVCVDCHQTKPVEKGSGTGYAGRENGAKVCYACCALMDVEYMRKDGQITLYDNDTTVSNWPGTLSFNVTHRTKGRHNMAGTVHTLYFAGPDGAKWSGRRTGENTQIVRCRRLKGRARR
jgi:hypothetical protein